MEQKTICLPSKDREVYLEGIKKFMLRGIPVLIDGVESGEKGLKKLFSPPEGTFYMADYVIEELPEEERAAKGREGPVSMLRETQDENEDFHPTKDFERYILKEIRFDQAYHS